MKDRDSFRGTSIDKEFAEAFKKSKFYKEIYDKHRDEIIIGIRDSSINLYHNCNSIASIKVSSPHKCDINKYYTNKEKKHLTEDEIVDYFEIIRNNSIEREKLEKQAQQRLFIDNNNNPSSEWFCIDVEYTKSLKGKKTAEDWRFDIIAISKEKPFRVALIELKYGSAAIGGTSGIRTHVKDFYSFFKNNKFKLLVPEIVSIINKLSLLGVDVPQTLKDISEKDIVSKPEFYFVILNNNPEPESDNTPKKKTSGYLFNDKRWECKRISSSVKKEGDYFELIENSKSFKPHFYFSQATLPNLNIKDILDKKYYDTEII